MKAVALAMIFFLAATLSIAAEKDAPPTPIPASRVKIVTGATALSKERIVFRTNVGDIAVALYPEVAPQTTAQILNLARRGVFNSTVIYRVEPGFVAQIENFDTRRNTLTNSQLNEIHKIQGEFSNVHHRRGILSMARYDDPESAEASFSFVLGEAPSLDKNYAVFGEIVAGEEVLAEFEKNATNGPDGKPKALVISSADVFEDGNLANAKLTAAHDYENPDANIGRIVLVFAILAFVFTILKPIVAGVMEKPKAKAA